MKKIIIEQDLTIDYRLSEDDFLNEKCKSENEEVIIHGGRGASCITSIGDKKCVLRHYVRGGAMAFLLKDKYLWSGLERSRPYQEFKVIKFAESNKLPVPHVVAYCLEQNGFYYRASIITEFIDNQGTLASLLYTDSLASAAWKKLGYIIRKFHDAGIYHADLNANNILIDRDEGFHLIDFDKAKIINYSGKWRNNNINRLYRSLNKIKQQRASVEKAFNFSTQNWHYLLQGYSQD